jgi:hypothetical protein
MAALVEAFIDSVRSVEHFAPGSDRCFAIRNKITEYESILRGDGDQEAVEVIGLFLQLAKDSAFEQSFRHMVDFRPTPTSEFFQEVLEELSLRIRLTIRESKNGSFQVRIKVIASNGAPSEEIQFEFDSIDAAQKWIDSDEGNTLIKALVEKYEK